MAICPRDPLSLIPMPDDGAQEHLRADGWRRQAPLGAARAEEADEPGAEEAARDRRCRVRAACAGLTRRFVSVGFGCLVCTARGALR
eukprot:SAG31_NODE_675_length_12908_cov_11.596612_6_plen_87_part_00